MRVLLALALLLHAGATTAQAQLVRGRLLEAETGGPIPAGTIELIRNDTVIDEAVTDTAGSFTLQGDVGGEYRIRAERIGFRSSLSQVLALASGARIDLEYRLSTEVIGLDPITVITASRSMTLERKGFFDRENTTAGAFITREELGRPDVRVVTDVLRRLPGVQVVRMGMTTNDVVMRGGRMRNCLPRIYLNGTVIRQGGAQSPGDPVLDQFIKPTDIEGIEVYRSSLEIPAEFGGGDAPCGALVIWTR